MVPVALTLTSKRCAFTSPFHSHLPESRAIELEELAKDVDSEVKGVVSHLSSERNECQNVFSRTIPTVASGNSEPSAGSYDSQLMQ